MLGLTLVVASIALADSINPSTVIPALWLALTRQPLHAAVSGRQTLNLFDQRANRKVDRDVRPFPRIARVVGPHVKRERRCQRRHLQREDRDGHRSERACATGARKPMTGDEERGTCRK